MTREEAIDMLYGMKADNLNLDDAYTKDKYDALEMAIQALEQEPKTEQEDDYFRKIVEVAISQLRADRDRLEDELAKREQESKTGHWIEKDGFDGDVYYDCSECGESWTTIEGTPWQNGMAYCPNCGCRMVEPQESEDKDADKKCTYKETGCGSCKRQLDCPIEADTSESEE